MDILRKELSMVYAAQHLDRESLPVTDVVAAKSMAETVAAMCGGLIVITDAACDRCYIYGEGLGRLIGLDVCPKFYMEVNSSDEDDIYNRLHPEDLVDKRMLEYEFFKMADSLRADEKKSVKATCHIRMMNQQGEYRYIDNSTQVVGLSPGGKIWLILCCYSLSPVQSGDGINPHIVNNGTGEIRSLSFGEKRKHILTDREKEILRLIREGYPSKIIADRLGISIHTVNRHRQNIIRKLSVGNSIEAVTAATAMNLL